MRENRPFAAAAAAAAAAVAVAAFVLISFRRYFSGGFRLFSFETLKCF